MENDKELLDRLKRIARSAQYLQTTRADGGMQNMSQALWCDAGDHAFSARDIEKKHGEWTVYDANLGKEVTEPYDTCGKHAGMFQPGMANAVPTGADKVLYEEFLEWKAGINRPAIQATLDDSP
jgi:hypothetical protein